MGIPFLRDLNKKWLVFAGLLMVAYVLYFPIIHNSFIADDFKVMYRVGVHGELLVPGFFRPLSDLTLYLNYRLGHFNPIIYYLTNILFHAFCSFLIFCFCMKAAFVSSSIKDKQFFSVLSAIFFLTYPFHNESIAWVIGRASLMATFFGIACLLVVVSDIKKGPKFFFAGLFYFTGLLSYESIFPIPAIVILLLWRSDRNIRQSIYWSVLFTVLLIIHFILRKSLSGVITGDYGQDLFSYDVLRYVVNILKISGRMFLPPTEHNVFLMIAFALVICSFLVMFVVGIKRNNKSSRQLNEYIILVFLCISLIVPFTFSVSTRTSEGDRLLYFPSMFLCILFALLITEKIKSRVVKKIVILCLLFYNVLFLEINNFNWKKASSVTNTILSQVSEICCSDKKITIVNLPGEYKGAYIFRNGFREAMLLRNLDTSSIHSINYVNNAEYVSLPPLIEPIRINDTIYLGKSIKLYGKTLLVSDFKTGKTRSIEIPNDAKQEIWYWNKIRLKRLIR